MTGHEGTTPSASLPVLWRVGVYDIFWPFYLFPKGKNPGRVGQLFSLSTLVLLLARSRNYN